ncbi:putative bzip transcription factor [Diplodia seriata]|uniref:Putative bzip transcription factor n=1 Tax=Diplodia seriata TaxID=420778 RepID=A0A0G2GYV7_9PEZI|nr:putative bzip transcription factor [Diplodia seriata]
MGDNNTAKDTPAAVGKSEEPSRDGSASSIATTPEPEAESYSAQEQPQQQQKRKGGRKPIYATSEERKQRNRQAQAAFRERRTEYIKQLESTIKHHEETLQTLQQNHRSAADECLMLRYKNSLLERILLEKGTPTWVLP